MSKIIVIPNDIKMIEKVADKVDGFILGIKDLSVNLPCYFSLSEASLISEKHPDKEIFISLNKNMHSKDLKPLEETMKELENLHIKGILFYDIALVNLKNKLNLKIDLVWSQEHHTTNLETINYWFSKGVKYTNLSNEITLDEVKIIIKESNAKLMLQIFGYIPTFTSIRPLVKNYLETFKIDTNSEKYYLHKEGLDYPIVDNNLTTTYSGKILNSIEELPELDKVEYLILNSFDIKEDDFIKVLEIYHSVIKAKTKPDFKAVDDILNNNTNKGLLLIETIYKVKK